MLPSRKQTSCARREIKLSKQIGALMAQGKKEEAEEVKKQVAAQAARLEELSAKETELNEKVTKIMMTLPNIIDPSVPIGKDDTENVEVTKYGDPVVRILKFRTTRRLWSALTALIWTAPEK